ncbi:MAG: hypothetical protein K5660_03050, partial [Paludibacteraceae bacterium]|nr:hypothetical protein [Paludibacteraceae bacterium]
IIYVFLLTQIAKIIHKLLIYYLAEIYGNSYSLFLSQNYDHNNDRLNGHNAVAARGDSIKCRRKSSIITVFVCQ